MDGGWSDPAGWRSSIPGVSQREGAAVSLGIVATEGRPSSRATGGGRDESRAGRPGVTRAGRRTGRRAVGLAVLGLAAILGIAQVAGNVGIGPVDAGAEAGWQGDGQGDGEGEPRLAAEPSGASSEPGGSARSGGAALLASVGVLLAEPPDWWAVLAELDRRRTATLGGLDLDALADHALPAAPAWDADAALLADLQERGLRPRGLTSRVLAVERADRQGDRARLLIVDQRSAYELVDAEGEPIDRVDAAVPTRWAVTLQRATAEPREWRLVDVVPAPEQSPAEQSPAEQSPAEGEEVP